MEVGELCGMEQPPAEPARMLQRFTREPLLGEGQKCFDTGLCGWLLLFWQRRASN